MGEIDEIHQPERDREPACQHEQQHAVGDPVEQNGQHGGSSSPRRRSYTDGGTGSDARPLPAAVSRFQPRTHDQRAGLGPRAPLVSRFRSSQTLAALSDANFGIKGTLATLYF